jgi:hypothetical protein
VGQSTAQNGQHRDPALSSVLPGLGAAQANPTMQKGDDLFCKIEGKDPVHHHAHGHSQVIKVVREFEGDLYCDIEPIRWNLRVEVCIHSTRKVVLRCVQCSVAPVSRREERAAHGTYLQNGAIRRVYYVKAHN